MARSAPVRTTRRRTGLALALTAAVATVGASAQSASSFDLDKLFPIGKSCPQQCPSAFAPCCNDGWCSTSPLSCMRSEGCNAAQSYRGSCTPVPMCKSFKADFNDPAELINRRDYKDPNGVAKFWRVYDDTDNASIEDGNMVLDLKWNDAAKQGRGATIASLRFMQYGTVTARIKTAPGAGVVSSFITKTAISDTIGDEVDYEFIGNSPTEVQTNFYVNGEIDYTKGARWNFTAASGQTTTGGYHEYSIDWSADRMVFKVDGTTIRTVTAESVGDKYPRQLMRVYFSVWDGGCNTPDGTKQWAGGETDWCSDESKRSQSRKMYIDWVEVKCATEDPVSASTYVATIQKAGSAGSTGSVGSTAGSTPRTGGGGSPGSGSAGTATGAAGDSTGNTVVQAAAAAIVAGVAALVA